MFAKVCKPSDLNPDDRRLSIFIQQEDDYSVHGPINMFGGIITDYQEKSPATVIVPLIIGKITPGMLMSYVSALTSCAVEMLKETDIPKEILRDLLLKAVDEGLNNKPISCRCQN